MDRFPASTFIQPVMRTYRTWRGMTPPSPKTKSGSRGKTFFLSNPNLIDYSEYVVFSPWRPFRPAGIPPASIDSGGIGIFPWHST